MYLGFPTKFVSLFNLIAKRHVRACAFSGLKRSLQNEHDGGRKELLVSSVTDGQQMLVKMTDRVTAAWACLYV